MDQTHNFHHPIILTKGVDVNVPGANKSDYILEVVKNIYGGKDADLQWYRHLIKGLIKLGFTQSKYDPCVFYRGKSIFLFYVDDAIFATFDESELEVLFKQLKSMYRVTDEGDLTDYLGIRVQHQQDGTIKLSQPHLIDQIIEDCNFVSDREKNRYKTKPRDTPALSSKVLEKDEDGKPHKATWHYRSVIGKFNFLEKSTRGELAYAVHQAARFSEHPKESNTRHVHNIVRFLIGTRDEGIIIDPKEPVFEVYADADFCGLFNTHQAEHDPNTARLRTGYVIMFAKCPVVWASKLKTEFAFSSTESEYISLKSALREVIPLMGLLDEYKEHGILMDKYIPRVYCKAFEDNSGAYELATVHKMHPRTKHINQRYHHFRSYVASKKIQMFQISTEDQLAGLFTKPLPYDLFSKFVQGIFGWKISDAFSKFGYKVKDSKDNLRECTMPLLS